MLYERFQRQAALCSARPALHHAGCVVSYAELQNLSLRIASDLNSRFKSNSDQQPIVGLLFEPGSDMVAAVLGALAARVVYVPLDPRYPLNRLQYMLAHSECQALLTNRSTLPQARALVETAPDVDLLLIEDCDASHQVDPRAETATDQPAYILYTSGSSGRPKGVVQSEQNLLYFAEAWIELIRLSANDRVTMLSSFSHDASIPDLFGSLLSGATLCMYDVHNGGWQHLVQWLKDEAITVWHSVPTIFRQFAQRLTPGDIFPDLRLIALGGEAVRDSDIELVRRRFPGAALSIIYGQSESTITSLWTLEKHQELQKPSLGCPIGATRLFLTDEQGVVVQEFGSGEIVIASSHVALGYWRDERASAHAFTTDEKHGRLFWSGDVGVLSSDGNIRFAGRSDAQQKIRGHRVEPAEIESVLQSHPAISNSAVVAHANANGENELHAFFVSSEPIDASALRELLLPELPAYMIPRWFTRLEQLPLLENGKLDRAKLAREVPHESKREVSPLRTEAELKVAAIWRQLLGVDEIGPGSDFFDLGGQSLIIIELLSLIHEVFQVELTFKDVFRYRTVAQLANLVEESRTIRQAPIKRAESREYYELSSAQKRMFVLSQFDYIGTTYNMPLAVDVDGPLDRARLHQAVRDLIKRHESLRMSCHLIAGTPVQVVHDNVECEIEEVNVSEDDINSAIDKFVRPFNLSHAPLFRLKILNRENNRFTILSDIHHIICDGTSREVWARDLISLYAGQTLPPLEITYRDYATWQAQLNRTGALRAQEKYWLDLLADGVPALNLPTDFERPAAFSFKGSILRGSLSEEATERFRNLAASQGATLFMTTLAVFSVVLQQRTRQPDIVVGVSVNGRHHSALRPLIGMFVNELVVWNRPRGEMSFSEFLSDVRRNSLQALANSEVPFDHLVERLNPARDMSRNPLFTVCLSMSPSLSRTIDPAGMRFTRRRATPNFSKFDLTLFVSEDGDRIHFDFEYCTDLFLPATIAGLSRQLTAAIDAVCNDPHMRLADIGFAEARRSPRPYQRTPFVSQALNDHPVHRLFEQQGCERPEAVAVSDGSRRVSYRELNERANQVAHYLCNEKGIRLGEPVALLLDNSIELVIAVLGILKAGASYVPIDPSFPEDRVRAILNDTHARVVLSQRDRLRLLNRLQWECPQFDAFCCLDSTAIDTEVESAANMLMSEELWNYVASTSSDDITGGGWTRSDNGLPFTSAEMTEYVENTFQKIAPLLHAGLRVLEIGCASGLTLFRIAPLVGSYHATDLSEVMVEKTRREVQARGLQNVQVEYLPAHAIDQLDEGQFDLIILNSVVQSFHGHNYLRNVLAKAITLLKDSGHIFLGDLMDLDRKGALIEWLEEIARTNHDGARAKIDWSAELFVSPAFIDDLQFDLPEIVQVEISDKWRTIENELTRFRFDALLTIDRHSRSVSRKTPRKQQDDLRLIDQCPTTHISTATTTADVAYVVYTSGTTGHPKGVVVEHRSLVNYVTWAAKKYEVGPHSIFPLCTPISFDLTLTALFVPLVAGGSVRIHEAGNAALSMTQALSDEQITAIKLTPSHLDLLSVANIPAASRLRTFVIGGEDLKSAIARRIEEHFSSDARIFNEYGPTEATVGCMAHQFDRRRDCYTSVPIGEAIDNVDVYILDEHQRPVPDGTAGELYISGAAVARGYLNHAAATAHAFLPDPFNLGQRMYRTGDLAWRRPNGVIEFLGRIDDQLKIHGHRIELREIEACILAHPGVSKAAVVVVKDGGGRHKQLCAYFVARRELGDEDLRSFLKRRLPDYMLPTRFVQTPDLHFNENGKLDRQRLPTITTPLPDVVQPRTPLERQLAQIWSEVLGIGIERIGLASNFFALGGHSLSAVTLVSRVRSELKLQMGLADVFSFPDLGEFARHVSDAESTIGVKEAIARAEAREYYPASYSQQTIYRKHAAHPGKYNHDLIVYEARGHLDLERFRIALHALMKRHEILRTSFHEIHEQIVQRIHDDLEVPLQVNEGHATDVHDYLLSQQRPFRLEEPPLWRVQVVRIDPELHYLHFDLHHILYDGDSIAYLLDDFGKLYRGAKQLPPLDLQYKDYAVWEQHNARRVAGDKAVEFSLEGVKYTKLPPTKDTGSATGHAILNVALDPEAETALTRLSRQLNCTRLSILLAAFFQIINRETRDDEVGVGLRVSTRRQHELQKTVGPFLAKLPVYARVPGNESLGTLARRLQSTLFRALDHGRIKTDEQSARFPILVNYQFVNDPADHTFGLDVTVTPFRQESLPQSAAVPYEFVLAVFDQPGRVGLRGLYDQSLYSQRFVRQLLVDIAAALCECDPPKFFPLEGQTHCAPLERGTIKEARL